MTCTRSRYLLAWLACMHIHSHTHPRTMHCMHASQILHLINFWFCEHPNICCSSATHALDTPCDSLLFGRAERLHVILITYRCLRFFIDRRCKHRAALPSVFVLLRACSHTHIYHSSYYYRMPPARSSELHCHMRCTERKAQLSSPYTHISYTHIHIPPCSLNHA